MRNFFAISVLLASSAPALSWSQFEEKDAITDVVTIAISRMAESTILRPQRRPELKTPSARLAIRCQGGKPAIIYYVQNWLVAGRTRNVVQYRFDAGKPVSSTAWSSTDDSSGIGLWSSGSVKSFLTASKGKKKLIFRTSTSVFGETEAIFDVSDLQDYVGVVLAACKLKI